MILCMLFIYKGFIQIYVFEYSIKNSETVSRDVLRKKVFLKLTGKTYVRVSLLIKVAGLRPATLLTLFRMGIFGATHGWGERQKGPPP